MPRLHERIHSEFNPKISDFVSLEPIKKENPKKSLFRKLWEAICRIANQIFSCFSYFHKNKNAHQSIANPNSPPSLSLVKLKRYRNTLPAPLKGKLKLTLPKTTPTDAPALALSPKLPKSKYEEALSGDLTRHLKMSATILPPSLPPCPPHNSTKISVLALGHETVHALTVEVMQKQIFPCVPKVTKYATDMSQSMCDITAILRYFKDLFGTTYSSNKTEKMLKHEEKVHSRILHNTIKLIVDPKDVNIFLNQFLIPEKGSEELLPYISPAVEWLKESYKSSSSMSLSLKDFIVLHAEKYNITEQGFDKHREELIEFALKKISEKLFSHLNTYLEGQQALITQLEDPVTVIESAEELIHVNLATVTDYLLTRVFDLLSKVNVSDLLYNNLPLLTNQLTGAENPTNPDEIEHQGSDIVDLLFPLVNDGKEEKEVRTVDVLIRQLHLPKLIKDIHIPALENILVSLLKRVNGAKELSDEQKCALNDLAVDGKELIIQSILKSVVTPILEQIVDKIKNPFFIHEKMAEHVLPAIIEKLISVFAKQILARHIDAPLTNCFKKLVAAKALPTADATQVAAEKEAADDCIHKWNLLMQDSKKGFNSFTMFTLQGLEYDDSKCRELLAPLVDAIGDRLLFAKKAHANPLEHAEMKKVIIDYLNTAQDIKVVKPTQAFLNETPEDSKKPDAHIQHIADQLIDCAFYQGEQFTQPKNQRIVSANYIVPFLRKVHERLKNLDQKGPKELKETLEDLLVRDKPKPSKSIEAMLIDYFNIDDQDDAKKEKTLLTISDALLTHVHFNECEVEFTLKEMGVRAKDFMPAVVVFISRIEQQLDSADKEDIDVNTLNGVIHEIINPKLTAASEFIQLVLEKSELIAQQNWLTKKVTQFQWAQSLIKSKIHFASQVMLECMIPMDELLEIILTSLREEWTTEVKGVKKIDINKVLMREPTIEELEIAFIEKQDIDESKKEELMDSLARRVKSAKLVKLDLRLRQFTALLTDLSSQAAYHGSKTILSNLSYLGTKSVTNPAIVNTSIKKIYDKLFSESHRNKQLLINVFRRVIDDLNEVSDELALTQAPVLKHVEKVK